MQIQPHSDRISERREVLLAGRCRKSLWHVFAVEIGDLSQGGCSIVGSTSAFSAGDRVQLRIANMKPVDAQVRWFGDDRVGVEFRVALKRNVVDALLGAYGIETAYQAGR